MFSRRRGLAIALLLALSGASLDAQTFRLGRWTGFVEAGYDKTEETAEALGGTRDTPLFDRTRFEQKLGLRNRLTVLDPRVLVVHYGVTLGLLQNDFAGDRGDTSGDGRVAGYDLTAGFFPQRRFSLDLLANRYESVVPQEFAGTVEVETRNYGATLRMRRIFLPGSISYRDTEIETSTSRDPLLRGRDERRRTLNYLGTRQWQHHRLNVSAELSELDDRLFSALDHRRVRGSVHHVLELRELTLRERPSAGPRRARQRHPGRLTSRVSVSDRSGNFGASSFDWSESLHLQHRDRVSSNFTYQHRSFETAAGRSDTDRASLVYRHDLYESLETEGRVETRRTDFDNGRSAELSARFDVDYQKRIPGGRLRLGADLGRERRDDRFEGGETFVSRERHVARFGEPFRLALPNVILSSILVVDEAGTTIFLESVDYAVQAVGVFVEITAIPGGGIGDGDSVLVDYRRELSPEVEFDTRTEHLHAAIDFGWIEPYASWQRRDETIRSGFDDGTLDELRLQTEGVRLRRRGRHWTFDARGERRARRSRLLAFDQENLDGRLTVRPARSLRVTLAAQEQRTDFSQPLRETRLASLRASLDWRPRPGLSVELFGGERRWRDTLSLDEDFDNAGVRARLKLGHLELVGSLAEWTRRRGGDEFESLRATFRITRRFLPGGNSSGTAPRGRSGPWMGDLPDPSTLTP